MALSKITGFKLARQGGADSEKDSWPEDSEAGASSTVTAGTAGHTDRAA